MPIVRSFDSAENQLIENNMFLRIERGNPPGMINSLTKMRVQYKPELGGIAINSPSYNDLPVVIDHPEMDFLSKNPYVNTERATILRDLKLQPYNLPISPLSPLDAVGMGEASSVYDYRYGFDNGSLHFQNSSISSGLHFPSSVYSEKATQYRNSIDSDSLGRKYLTNNSQLQSIGFKGDVQETRLIIENPEGIKQRLLELERELFCDDESSIVRSSLDHGKEWVETIEGYMLEESLVHSPMESTNASGNSDNKTDYQVTSIVLNEEHSSSNSHSSSLQEVECMEKGEKEANDLLADSPKQLLYECAIAVSDCNLDLATKIITKLREVVSIQGSPMERLSAYMVEGLAARIASSGQGIYKALRCKEAPSSDMLSAMQVIFEACPYFKFGYMAANAVMCEAFKDEKLVHIIDFEMGQGTQYMELIKLLAERPGGSPRMRMTGLDDPVSIKRSAGGLEIIGKRLEQFAREYGVTLQFIPIAQNACDVQANMFDLWPEEALAVNFSFQLHHMPDESVSTKNPRDHLLRLVKSLKPKIVTLVEQEVNTNTAPFLPRFIEAFNYYAAIFESLDATMPRESKDRVNVEKQCLARDIVNIIACEGAERVERYEVTGKWRVRMSMAGLKMFPLSSNVGKSIIPALKLYCNSFKMKEDGGAIYFGWMDKALIATSAWH